MLRDIDRAANNFSPITPTSNQLQQKTIGVSTSTTYSLIHPSTDDFSDKNDKNYKNYKNTNSKIDPSTTSLNSLSNNNYTP